MRDVSLHDKRKEAAGEVAVGPASPAGLPPAVDMRAGLWAPPTEPFLLTVSVPSNDGVIFTSPAISITKNDIPNLGDVAVRLHRR